MCVFLCVCVSVACDACLLCVCMYVFVICVWRVCMCVYVGDRGMGDECACVRVCVYVGCILCGCVGVCMWNVWGTRACVSVCSVWLKEAVEPLTRVVRTSLWPLRELHSPGNPLE